ncbi:Dihydrolipoyllysine-residue acetyltransferase component of pyruvate dehydrogenase complex [Candidatus Hartigia pinicola]|nr:Dihydrolipoyllysine-residue acetyltransferase component of pyruvate dehydrogenase complex [Candidatus Hartigia pinicola]
MFIEIKVPDIGDNIVEVTEVMVQVGDLVKVDQSLIMMKGNETSIEIPSPESGVVKEIKIMVGDIVVTGKLIMLVESRESIEPPLALKPLASPVSMNTSVVLKEIHLPDIGEQVVEVTAIMVKIGDKVSADQSIITVEGDKVSMEIPAPFSGSIKEIIISIGDQVQTGSLIMIFEVTSTLLSVTTSIPRDHSLSSVTLLDTVVNNDCKSLENSASVHATPVIRRLAYEFGIDLSKVTGTGRKGRILREDLQNYIKDVVKCVESSSDTSFVLPRISPWPQVDYSKFGEIEEVSLSHIQKVSGANLSRNWATIPHVTLLEDIDITDVEEFRKQQNKEAAKKQLNVKITPVVFIMKSVARALEVMPRFNTSIAEDGKRLFMKKYINIGIAVDTPNGLVVPVFKNVNKKGIIDLSFELIKISNKAREGKLTASDIQGGCLTISNLGSIGTTSFSPIINAPEVAIIGLSRSSIKPVWDGSQFIPRVMLPISLSFDHRVIDGADSARFITLVAKLMNDIRRLVM